MNNTPQILHLASFRGNIGDIVNHGSFRRWFEKVGNVLPKWTNLEIRDYFRGHWSFDQDFIDLVNSHDLLVIGGGNFFETWPENSSSGTSIDLRVEEIEKIKKPVFINSIGLDTAQGISANARHQLPRIVKYFTEAPGRIISLRNDGSISNLSNLAPEIDTTGIPVLPDAAFYLDTPNSKYTDCPVLGVNLAQDMAPLRFTSGEPTAFLKVVTETIEAFYGKHPDHIIRFFPHIYSDFGLISRTLEQLSDSLRRESVQVVEYSQDDRGAANLVNAYADCTMVWAMRFHASVIPIGLGVPTLGIVTYPQIDHVFREVGMSDFTVDGLNLELLSSRILDISEILAQKPSRAQSSHELRRCLGLQREQFANRLKTWLTENRITEEV